MCHIVGDGAAVLLCVYSCPTIVFSVSVLRLAVYDRCWTGVASLLIWFVVETSV